MQSQTRTYSHQTHQTLPRPIAFTHWNRPLPQRTRRRAQVHAAAQARTLELADKETQLRNLCQETHVDWPECQGHCLVIRPLRVEWQGHVADLLTDAFAEAQSFKAYRQFLRQRIGSYVRSQVNLFPRTLILTATLQPPEQPPGDGLPQPAQSAREDGPASPTNTRQAPQQGEVLVGTVEVSWDRSTHSTSLTLNPPKKSAYLCNMAVDPRWRRKGIGQALIRAVEEACRIQGEDQLFLHLRLQDSVPAALYASAGFEQAAADPAFIQFLGLQPKKLMRKRVV